MQLTPLTKIKVYFPPIDQELLSKQVRTMKKGLDQFLNKTAGYFPVLVAVFGVILTIVSFWQLRTYNLERLEKKFEIDAYYISSTVEGTLREHMIELEALQVFFANDKTVDRHDFAAFTLQALNTRPGIRAFEWIRRVPYEERDAYEALERGEKIREFQIMERDDNGRLASASYRRYYYPVEYVEPLSGNERAVGYDLGSDPVRRQALGKAAETGMTAATAPIQLVQEPGSQSGFLVFKPIYAKNASLTTAQERNSALRGFVLGAFRAGDMVQGAFLAKFPKNIAVKIYDITQTGNEQLFFDNSADLGSNANSPSGYPAEKLLAAAAVGNQHDFDFAGRRWRIQVVTTPIYVHANLSRSHWLILPAGGVLTLLIFLIIRFLNIEILERKRVEKALLLSEQGLHQSNNELAAALRDLKQTQTQLVHQEKLAGIGQLAAGVAHEINNPLGFIVSNMDALKKYVSIFTENLSQYRELTALLKSEDPRIDKAVRQISQFEKTKKVDYLSRDVSELFHEVEEGLQRVHKIVVGLRLFSRVDQSDEFAAYNLNEGIETTLIVANNQIKYNALIEKNFGQIPLVEARGGEINQVLLNLLVNAAQAITEKNKASLGTIRISTYGNETHAFCEIEDTGAGIPPERQKDIFNPFYTTKPVGQGTGLGLSICYDIIVNRHHGEIHVESIPGQYTKFSFKLPLSQNRALDGQNPAEEGGDKGV